MPFSDDLVKGRRAPDRNLMVRAPDEASPPGLLDLVIISGRASLLPRRAGVLGVAGITGSGERAPAPGVAAVFLGSSAAVCS